MFSFKTLELMNWDCYPHYRVPMDGEIVLLVGQNGSGKTTFLDALRVLLNASRLSKSRTLHHYIKKDVKVAMLKAVVTNKLIGKRRPFAHLGIYGDCDVSLVCLLHNRGPQKIDKEYFILKGDIPPEEIRKQKNGLKPLQYSRQLEEAGVSRSTLKLIALEQGQTDRIGQLSPNDLLQLVMDITGNRDIIKRYEGAKRNYRKTFHQLIELQTEYNKRCDQNQHLEKQAQQAQIYRELTIEKELIEKEKLPLSKWYKVLNQIHEAERGFQELREKKIALEKQAGIIPQEQKQHSEKYENLEIEYKKIREQQSEYEQKLNKLHQQIGQCHSEWQRLDNLRQSCEKIASTITPKKLSQQIDSLQTEYYQEKSALSQMQNNLGGFKSEFITLQRDRLPSYPDEIIKFRRILENNSIFNLLFAECIEITDPKWQLAIEVFLARERFSVFVEKDDFLRAKKLGEKNRYGYYITPFSQVRLSKPRSQSILSYLKIIDDRIGERLLSLNDVLLVDSVEEGHRHAGRHITITAQGYRQDRRGGIFIARKIRFFCGGLAVEQQLEELERDIVHHTDQIAAYQKNLREKQSEIRKLEDQLVRINKKDEWESSQKRYESLKEQGEILMAESEQVVTDRNKLNLSLDKIMEEKNRCLTERQEFQKELDKIQAEIRQIAETMANREQILLQLRWEKEELDKQIPTQTKDTYTPDQLEPTDWLERKHRELCEHIETYGGCRELSMINLYQHEVKQLENKKRQLNRQEEDQSMRSQELEKCRDDYRQMIAHTVNFYNKSVRELAELAGCRMRVILELGAGDALIEDAKLFVRISFDQKAEVDIQDKSLSGGQDVIASVILLVALSRLEKEESSGFFIMDEHNAHLDMLRIMEVGHFLRSTKAQFVLTTPTTENMAALAVADLILTFTKITGKSEYAQKPRYIRRM